MSAAGQRKPGGGVWFSGRTRRKKKETAQKVRRWYKVNDEPASRESRDFKPGRKKKRILRPFRRPTKSGVQKIQGKFLIDGRKDGLS